MKKRSLFLLVAFAVIACKGAEQVEISSVWPRDGATSVPLNTSLEVAFDAPIKLGSGGSLSLILDGQQITGEVTVGQGGGPLVFTPDKFLLPGRTYRAVLQRDTVRDLEDKRTNPEIQWSFSTMEGCDIQATQQAYMSTGPTDDGAVVIPGGRLIKPWGQYIQAGSFPMNLLSWPDRTLAVISNDGKGLAPGKLQSIQLVDTDRAEVLQTINRDRPGSFFFGLALSDDGTRLYVAGGGDNKVEIFHLAADGLSLEKSGEFEVGGYPSGLELDEQRHVLFVTAQLDGDLVAVDLDSGEEAWRKHLGVLPYDIKMSPDNKVLFVSMWGRSDLDSPGQVVAVDADTSNVLAKIDVGKNPEAMAMASDGRLFVPCSDADRIDVIDTRTKTVVMSINLRRDGSAAVGLSPSSVALDESRGRLYVTCAQKNSVDVLDMQSGDILGSIPTAWYPTAVGIRTSDGMVLVSTGKGQGIGPKESTDDIHKFMHGSLNLIAAPTDEQLEQGAAEVKYYNERPLSFFPDRCLGKAFPLPRSIDEPSPIKHVVFILRENKTYDQNLGDLETGDGDPDLVMFGENLTPNLHALAREFCSLDNFYADIEVSVQGHYWMVAGTINDYSERIWHASYRDDSRFPSTGTQQADYPAGKYIWQNLFTHDIPFRDYGEPLGVVGEMDKFAPFVNSDYMLDLGMYLYSTPDTQRVEWIWEEIEAGMFPPFLYVALLNDHTYGTKPGQPTPQWMVAENDYATGLLVDRITHSKYWPETLIIITEDDPQSGADHIDGHRSFALFISPFTKKGYTSSVQYSFSSLIRTYSLILGLPALNILDESAAPVYDCFRSEPDLSTYDVRDMNISYEENNYATPGALASDRMDFTTVDRADGLGKVLWLATHPNDPLPEQLKDEQPWQEQQEDEEWTLPVPIGPGPWKKEAR